MFENLSITNFEAIINNNNKKDIYIHKCLVTINNHRNFFLIIKILYVKFS